MRITDYNVTMQSTYGSVVEQNNIQRTEVFKDTLKRSHHQESQTQRIGNTLEKTNVQYDMLERELVGAVLQQTHQNTFVDQESNQVIEHVGFKQHSTFSMKATIKTGSREYNVDIDVALKSSHTQIKTSTLSDPVVINFNGALPDLSNQTFAFDIDNDGESDQVSKLKNGNGFLAIDLNGNNTIDDGSELFGPNSGSGFGELKEHDSDGNGFIDENDPIFDKLRVWIKTDSEDRLVSLGEVGIGAIFIEAAKSNYHMINEGDGSVNGVATSHAFVLFEDGRSSLASEIHMAKHQKENKEAVSQINLSERVALAFQEYSGRGINVHDHAGINQISVRIKQLQQQMESLKLQLFSANDEMERRVASARMALVQGQIIALLSSKLYIKQGH